MEQTASTLDNPSLLRVVNEYSQTPQSQETDTETEGAILVNTTSDDNTVAAVTTLPTVSFKNYVSESDLSRCASTHSTCGSTSFESIALPRSGSEGTVMTTLDGGSTEYEGTRASDDQSELEDGADEEDKPPSTTSERQKLFRSYLTMVSSCVYGVFIVTFGVLIYIMDAFSSQEYMIAEGFGIYLVSMGLLYYIFLKIDTKRYLYKLKHRANILSSSVSEKGDPIGGVIWVPTNVPNLTHDYCFTSGRHSGSFYLKCGATVFCFGLLIHSGIQIGYQVVFLTSNDTFSTCGSVVKLIRDTLHPIYAFFQLYFIFKQSNIIINRYKELARFAVMHCIATSLCFWVWTILDESVVAMRKYNVDIKSLQVQTTKAPMPDAGYQTVNVTAHHLSDCVVSDVFGNFSPYLFPFTIEYSIMVAGVLYIVWQNIGNCSEDFGGPNDPCGDMDFEPSKLVIHADCKSATKGIFAGLVVLAVSVVSIILYWVVISDSEYLALGMKVNKISALVILIVMTLAAFLAYYQITRLDANSHPVNQLDDLLLFICIPAYFIYAIFSIPPAIAMSDHINIIKMLLQVFQVLVQTPLIMDGLRRCSNSRALRHQKPGKELITFLIVCNLSMWISDTFQIKSNSIIDYRNDEYGYVMWIIIKHMTVPLQMFYRFHSSVCLVDIWKSAYKKS